MVIFKQEQISGLKALLDTASRVVVLGHTHPDGDALGSTAALCLFVKKELGKEACCLFNETPPENLRFLLAREIPYLLMTGSRKRLSKPFRRPI